jgi:hypothetical protein
MRTSITLYRSNHMYKCHDKANEYHWPSAATDHSITIAYALRLKPRANYKRHQVKMTDSVVGSIINDDAPPGSYSSD